MGRRPLYFALFLVIAGIWLATGCKKSNNEGAPLEPISLIEPDSVTSQQFAGDTVGIRFIVTASKPINYIQCLYDLGDTAGTANYQPSFPDTLFTISLANDSPRVSTYTASAVYHIPDSLPTFSVIYFKAFFTAGNSTFVVGQNYPAGIDSASKTFIVNVR